MPKVRAKTIWVDRWEKTPARTAQDKIKRRSPGRQQSCWGSLFCTNLTQPTGAVDTRTADTIYELFHKLNKELGITIIIVTHDMALAGRVDRTVLISDGKVSTEKLKKHPAMEYTVLDEKTYSINDPKEERINILKSEDGQYSIFFLDKNGKKYILEQETENPFVFKRFYNEVTYYGETMRQIREYEEVFEDKLEDDVKIQLLGY